MCDGHKTSVPVCAVCVGVHSGIKEKKHPGLFVFL